MEVSLSSAVSFLDESPVVFSMGRSTDVVKTEEAPLTTFMEQAGSEMAALYETAQRCNATLGAEIAGLNLQNGDLGQQLEASMGRERELKILHGTETQVLKDEVAFLKSQMDQLREESRRETERLQGLLTAAQQKEVTALAVAKATFDQQKTLLEQQNTALQSQVSLKDEQLLSKDNQLSAKDAQIDHLKKEYLLANAEAQRQKVAFIDALTPIKETVGSVARMGISLQTNCLNGYCYKNVHNYFGSMGHTLAGIKWPK